VKLAGLAISHQEISPPVLRINGVEPSLYVLLSRHGLVCLSLSMSDESGVRQE